MRSRELDLATEPVAVAPTTKSRRVPFAVCVGAAKAGTTTLYALMARHPEVTVSLVKETDFYYNPATYRMGFETYLERYFAARPGTRMFFEADPVYMYGLGCIDRMHACIPDARIIVMLRNPVDRAFSQYVYRMRYRRYDESFEQMCLREDARIRVDEAARMEYGCLDRSRYLAQVQAILQRFPRKQVYFILFEEFVRNQRAVFAALQRWLGLTETDVGEARENIGGEARSVFLAQLLYHGRYRWLRGVLGKLLMSGGVRRRLYASLSHFNTKAFERGSRPALDIHLRQRLLAQFAEEIGKLESVTGLDLELWRSL
jgi:hypothetical protein